jgi:hypothetical protein
MIDDIELIETPSNLIAIENIVGGGFWIDYANYSGLGLNNITGLNYSVTPLSQLSNHPYAIEGVIRNLGSNNQTSRLRYQVTGPTSHVGLSPLTNLLAYSPSNSVDSVLLGTTFFSPTTVGNYFASVWGESVQNNVVTATSDTLYLPFEVSDYIYAKDLGELNSNGSRLIGGPSEQWHLTTRYEMYANENLYSLRVFVNDASTVGAEIKAIIYELDSTQGQGNIFYEESDNYIITAQDLGSWVDISFVSPVTLSNGFAYEIGVKGFQHPTDSVYIGTSGESIYNGEHRLFDELGLSTQSAGVSTWYYITNTPMVRMNFDPSLITVISWDCDSQGNCSDPGTGQGTFTSLSACQANCIVVNSTWDCGANGCYDPGTGNGQFTSINDCNNACSTTNTCSELFISEYIEGYANNKALEIYNPTNNAINLNDYIVIRYSNGSTSASSASAVQLTGTIPPNDVHVGVIEKINPLGTGTEVPVDLALQLKADAFYCPDYSISNAWYWNGNDGVVLAKGNINNLGSATVIDVIGKIGQDPGLGWTNDSSALFTTSNGAIPWTWDHTLIRKYNILSGDANGIDYFNPAYNGTLYQ